MKIIYSVCLVVATVVYFPWTSGEAFAQTAPNAIAAPAQKMIGRAIAEKPEKPETVPSLIVMNSRGAIRDGAKLTLIGISPNSIIFADRPVRSAGHARTTHLIEEWAKGSDSFAKDPPNAILSVFSKSGKGLAPLSRCKTDGGAPHDPN